MTSLEIEAFLSIVRCRSISASAKELFVTQPALSRRLNALESELGYPLLLRQKGMHTVQLTREGQAFQSIAEKWMHLWEDTNALRTLDQRPLLRMASIGSVSTYILPEIFHVFLSDRKYNLEFHLYHSQEAYEQVEGGLIDIAFVSNPMYSRTVQTIPLFSEPFVLASRSRMGETSGKGDAATGTDTTEKISTRMLAPDNEVRIPWNQEYDSWHRQRFDESIYPNVLLDEMSLMEEFLKGDNWAIVPWSVGERLKKRGLHIYSLADGPTDRVIYYLIKSEDKKEMTDKILLLFGEYISTRGSMKNLISDRIK